MVTKGDRTHSGEYESCIRLLSHFVVHVELIESCMSAVLQSCFFLERVSGK